MPPWLFRPRLSIFLVLDYAWWLVLDVEEKLRIFLFILPFMWGIGKWGKQEAQPSAAVFQLHSPVDMKNDGEGPPRQKSFCVCMCIWMCVYFLLLLRREHSSFFRLYTLYRNLPSMPDFHSGMSLIRQTGVPYLMPTDGTTTRQEDSMAMHLCKMFAVQDLWLHNRLFSQWATCAAGEAAAKIESFLCSEKVCRKNAACCFLFFIERKK